jgi:hypothetical protein
MTKTPCLTVPKYQRSSYTSTAIVFFFPCERNDAALAQKLHDFDQNTMGAVPARQHQFLLGRRAKRVGPIGTDRCLSFRMMCKW